MKLYIHSVGSKCGRFNLPVARQWYNITSFLTWYVGEKSCFYQSIAILTCICLRRTVALFLADSPSFQSDFPLHKTCCSAWACSEKPSDLWCLSAKIDLITTTKKKATWPTSRVFCLSQVTIVTIFTESTWSLLSY